MNLVRAAFPRKCGCGQTLYTHTETHTHTHRNTHTLFAISGNQARAHTRPTAGCGRASGLKMGGYNHRYTTLNRDWKRRHPQKTGMFRIRM